MLPIAKDVSPDERQLGLEDIECIKAHFDLLDIRHFYLFHRLKRLSAIGQNMAIDRALQSIDRYLLALPGVQRFAGTTVLHVRKKA